MSLSPLQMLSLGTKLRKLSVKDATISLVTELLKDLGYVKHLNAAGRIYARVLKEPQDRSLGEILQDPQFQEYLRAEMTAAEEQAAEEVSADHTFTVCPHCNLPFQIG